MSFLDWLFTGEEVEWYTKMLNDDINAAKMKKKEEILAKNVKCIRTLMKLDIRMDTRMNEDERSSLNEVIECIEENNTMLKQELRGMKNE